MSELTISLSNASVSLDGEPALRDITWRLGPGESWAVLGGNGAGKSTFLRLVRGDIWPDPDGTGKRVYSLDGESQSSPVGLREQMSYVSAEQQEAYTRNEWWLSGEDAICSGYFDSEWLHQTPTPAQREAARALAASLDIAHLLGQSMLEISEGEARKVLIARVLVGGPRLLLLDEFCNGLDALSRRAILDTVERVIRNGTPVLYTTHRLDEVPPSVTHTLLLEEGRAVAQGPRDEVLGSAEATRMFGHGGQLWEDAPAPAPQSHLDGTLIRIEHADVFIEDASLLRDVTWRMNADENWAVLGRNGSGKSSLLKLIYGDLHPARGERVERFGHANGHSLVWEIRRRIGFISAEFQTRYGYDLTGEQVVQSGFFASVGLWDGVSDEQAAAARRKLRAFGLERLAGRSIRAMSYGELRRVLLARAVVNDPDLLILDEPCNGLDAPSRREFLRAVERLALNGTRLIYVTHHLEELAPAITHVLVMDAGRIVAQGPRDEVLAEGTVARLLGQEPGNVAR